MFQPICRSCMRGCRVGVVWVCARAHVVVLTYSMACVHQVYPIGIPVAFSVMLWQKRHLLKPAKNVHPTDALNLSEGQPEPPSDSDPRLLDRRIAHTAFLWRVSCSEGKARQA